MPFLLSKHPRVLALALLTCSAWPIAAVAQTPTNLLQNPSFEDDLSNGWTSNPGSGAKGFIYRSQALVQDGSYSLRMFAGRLNATSTDGVDMGVTQALPVDQYRGKPLYFSGWMQTKGPVAATIRLAALSSAGLLYFRELRQDQFTDGLTFHRDVLDIPDDPNIFVLFLTCSVHGSGGLATYDSILVTADPSFADWPMGQPDSGPALNASAYIDVRQTVRSIPRTLFGMNLEWVSDGGGLWDENINDFNASAFKLANSLGPVYWRFPGGLFADYYHWAAGVGPRDQRPARRPGPTNYTSSNAFGTDEAWALAQASGGGLVMTVNALTGTPEEAANWVRYVNSGQRHVDYWEVGNEMYLEFPADDTKPYVPGAPTIKIPPEDYAQRFLSFARAMKAADPSIKVGADIEFNVAVSAFRLYPDWAGTVLSLAGGDIDYLSLHNGLLPGLTTDAGWDVRTVYSAMLASPILLKRALQNLSAKIDAVAGPHAPQIRLGVTEWGPLFQTDTNSRFVDHVKTLGSSLFVASLLKTLIEDPRTDLANGFKFIDTSTQGWVGPRKGTFNPKAPYYALQMFAQNFGPLLVQTDTQSPTYDTRSIGWAEAVEGVPYLDVVSSTDQGQQTVYIIAINKHFDRSIRTRLVLSGFASAGKGTVLTLNGTGIDANTGTETFGTIARQAVDGPNGRFYLGAPDEVTLQSSDIEVSGSSFEYEFPAHSVTSIVLHGGPPPDQTNLNPPYGNPVNPPYGNPVRNP